MNSKLETDRYGVPQYSGQTDQFEEYVERAWDLWFGRVGQDSLQAATPVHLRAGLTDAAWEAVRKIEHTKLITKGEGGTPLTDGLELLLSTLKTALADAVPVKINELFLTAFYSPAVWRRQTESMQQYVVRREQDFRKLAASSTETQVSPNLRAMMLLIFSGLDNKEQLSVLSSVGNEYNFEKISHALRIQFPNAAGKPVPRRDYLGTGGSRGLSSSSSTHLFKNKFRSGPRKHHAFATDEIAEEDAFEEPYGEEADEAYNQDETEDASAHVGSDDEILDAFINEYDDIPEDDETVAEAFATVLQYKQQKRLGGKSKGKGHGGGKHFNFKGSGELTFDAKAKETRRQAVQFLKSVTPCTSCGARGHWNGDEACPNSKKSGKPSHGKFQNKFKSKSSSGSSSPAKKKPSSNLFVLHDALESDDERKVKPCCYVIDDDAIVSNAQVTKSSAIHVDVKPFEIVDTHVYDKVHATNAVLDPNAVVDPFEVSAYDKLHDSLDTLSMPRNLPCMSPIRLP